MPSEKLNALTPAVPTIAFALKHLESDDYYQQMLSVDSALQTLNMSRNNLKMKIKALAVSEGFIQPQSLYCEDDFEHFMTTDFKNLTARAAAEYDAIQQSLTNLDILAKAFEELQAAARYRFERRARSLRGRNTNIAKFPDEFPDEVLCMIFNNFRRPLDDSGPFFTINDEKADVTAIKNVRLTCKKFSKNSSHLLVRHLKISPNVSSLKHLEEVSSHPEIWRGERVLEIDLRYYSAGIAESFCAFAKTCYYKLQSRQECFQELLDMEEEAETEEQTDLEDIYPKGVSRESAEEAISQAEDTLSSWFWFRFETTTATPLDEAALSLQRGYERYRQLVQQQNQMLQDGHFVRTIAAAAAASGKGVWLSMSEGKNCHWDDGPYTKRANQSDLSLFADPHRLVQSIMVKPHQWPRGSYNTNSELEEAPKSLLYEIPLAMHTAGAKLVGLSVEIGYPEKLDLNLSSDQLSDLAEATRDLRIFSFCMNHMPQYSLDLYAYVRAVMSSENVQDLLLRTTRSLLTRFGTDPSARLQIEHLVSSPNWHSLKVAQFEHLTMDLEGLQQLMDLLKPGTCCAFEHIHLTSGTWAAALDCLRLKVGQGSYLLYPRGAETKRMYKAEYDRIFGDEYDVFLGTNKATNYITSVDGVENPLQQYHEAKRWS